MISINIEAPFKEILNSVTSHFQTNLQEYFKRHGHEPINVGSLQVDDVLIADGNVNTEFLELNIKDASPFTLHILEVQLENLNIIFSMGIKQIIIEGVFKQSSANTLVPINQPGKIRLQLEDITFVGKAGLFVVEDSFVLKNYDVNVQYAKLSGKITLDDGTIIDIFKNLGTTIENRLRKYISLQLTDSFYWEILHKRLGEVIVEYSVSELFQDEPAEIIALSALRASKANEFMDKILTKTNALMVANQKRTIETSALSLLLDKERNIFFKTQKGQLQDLSTCARVGDMSFYDEGEVQYIYGIIKLKDFKLNYSLEENSNQGVEVQVYRSQISVKLLIQKSKVSVSKVQTTIFRDIFVQPSGLGSYKEYQDLIKSCVIANIRSDVFLLLEETISDSFKAICASVCSC